MNSSLQIQPGTIPSECSMYDFVAGVPQHFSTQAYTVLVINIIILVATCPFTIALNVLTMIAVKVKTRLQSMSNIALACLAATDAMVGVISQPFYICAVITALQSEATSEVCQVQNVAIYSMNFFVFSSLAHLVLMSADRYMAIKRSYTYDQTVTKARVLISSAIAWILSSVILVFYFIDRNLFLSIQNSFAAAFIVLITINTVVVYCEVRRHEKQIAAQQVSVEAREKFLKEKRALKLSTTIIVILILNYLPIISFRIIKNVLKDRVSIDTIYALYFTAMSLGVVNSFVNPLIYSVRLRQFRVAFIELLLKKNRTEAEEFEKKLFAPNVANQGGEREAQNVNQANANINIETNHGGESEAQNVNQANANIDIETNQGEVREAQNVNQANVNIEIETNQGGESQAQNVNQANANIDIETNQGGESEAQNVSQANVNMDIETNQGGESEAQNVNQANATIDIETNQGGESEAQNVNQANVNIDIETNQGGESEAQNVNQANVNIDIETNQGGEREAKNVNRANANNDIETNQGGESQAQNVNQANVNIDIETNQGGESEAQNVNQANVNIDIETNQGGEREAKNVNRMNANNDIETNQGGESQAQNVNQANVNFDIETSQGGESEAQNVNQANASIDIETNQGGESEAQNVNQANANIDVESNQGGERGEEEIDVVQLDANIDIETNHGGERKKKMSSNQGRMLTPAWN